MNTEKEKALLTNIHYPGLLTLEWDTKMALRSE